MATRALAHRRKQTTLAATRDLHASFPRQCHLTAAEFANGVGGQWEPSGTPMRGQRETSGTSDCAGTTLRRCRSPALTTDCDLEFVPRLSRSVKTSLPSPRTGKTLLENLRSPFARCRSPGATKLRRATSRSTSAQERAMRHPCAKSRRMRGREWRVRARGGE